LKLYALNGSLALVACVLMYRDWATSEWTPEIVFRIVPHYVQILITLLECTTRHIVIHCHTSGDCKTHNSNTSSGRHQKQYTIHTKRRCRPNVVRLVLLGGDVYMSVQQQLVASAVSRWRCGKHGKHTPSRIIKIILWLGGVFDDSISYYTVSSNKHNFFKTNQWINCKTILAVVLRCKVIQIQF